MFSNDPGRYANFLIGSRFVGLPFQELSVVLYPDPFGMPFPHLSRTSSQPTLADSDLADAGGSTSGGCKASAWIESHRPHRPWKAKGPSTTDQNSVTVPPPERIPATGAVPDKLAEAWDAIKDGPKIADRSRALHAKGVGVSAAPSLISVFKTTAAAAEKTDIAKALNDGIDKFAEGIPILMDALDELKTLHPFIGGALIQ